MSEGFVKVAQVSDLPPGTMKTFTVQGQSILVANVGGKFYAIGAICNHKQWDLSLGALEGETVVCAGHGSIWDLKTGQGTYAMPLPPEPVYEIKVEGDGVLVSLKTK